MLKEIGIALLVLCAATAARSADVPTTAKSKAMVFRVNGLSDLGLSGPNEGFGLRYYLRDRLALRPILSFAWKRQRSRPAAGDPSQPGASDAMKIDTSVQLEVSLEKHLNGTKAISPYVGMGVYGTHYDYKTEPSLPQDPTTGTLSKITKRGTNASIFAMLGFEWGFRESLTLGGETRFGFNVEAGKKETERIRIPDQLSDEITRFNVGFDTVSLFLSVRW
jgi:opacity protein-like surface antigen